MPKAAAAKHFAVLSRSASKQIDKSANQQISKSANQQISKSANQHVTQNQTDKPVMVGSRFSRLCSDTLNHMAIDEGITLKALLGEAIDMLMRARGKHPFGER
jgi:hypothetical protein